MRSPLALLCVLAACSRGDRSNSPATGTTSSTSATASANNGPDALMLRVPRGGGEARIVAFPAVDSVVSISRDALPALDRVLGFDADAGLIAATSTKSVPLWIDLRIGRVITPSKTPLAGLVTADGSTIFGVGADGAVVRLTPSGNWVYKPNRPARAVFPQPNGTVIVLTGRGDGARVFRMHPPDVTMKDSLAIGDVRWGIGAPLADRLYFATNDRGLLGLRARLFEKGERIGLDHEATAMAATPSGDRFFVITDSSNAIRVVDRFQDKVSAAIELPGRPREMRVDAVGRFVLVRPATGDSVWVISTGTDTIVSTLRTPWRSDLPLVAPDGSVGLVQGNDVVFVDPASKRELHRAAGGASDFWYAFSWSGFRQRPSPPDFAPRDTTATDTTAKAAPKSDTVVAPPAPRPDTTTGFTVSFAALLNEAKAREQAAKIVIGGQTARVVTSVTDGGPVFRVVLGPYPTRDQADRIGRSSGQSYYVYAGSP
ncbi:MAG: SPOR domain-containing protein [Gemmatimonadaceae bacterium]